MGLSESCGRLPALEIRTKGHSSDVRAQRIYADCRSANETREIRRRFKLLMEISLQHGLLLLRLNSEPNSGQILPIDFQSVSGVPGRRSIADRNVLCSPQTGRKCPATLRW